MRFADLLWLVRYHPQAWRDRVQRATLDRSSSYRAVFETMLPRRCRSPIRVTWCISPTTPWTSAEGEYTTQHRAIVAARTTRSTAPDDGW